MSNLRNWVYYIKDLSTAEIISCFVIGSLYLIMAMVVIVSDSETFISKNNKAEYIFLTNAVVVITYAFLRENNNV